MVRLLDSELNDAEYKTFLGKDSKFVADLALTSTMIAALLTVVSTTLHASSRESLRSIGEGMSVAIWLVFLAETLIMIRLHRGWGIDWLRSHKLQLTVIFLANPLLVWSLEKVNVMELSILLPLPSFLKTTKLAKILKISKLLDFLHLSEVVTKLRALVAHVKWFFNSVLFIVGLVVLGIIGSVIEGNSLTPFHALDVWYRAGNSIVSSPSQVFLVSFPLGLTVVLVVVLRRKKQLTRSK